MDHCSKNKNIFGMKKPRGSKSIFSFNSNNNNNNNNNIT